MHYSDSGFVALEVAKFEAISSFLWLLNDDSIAADRVSHVAKVYLRASALVSGEHEACVPRARRNIVRHNEFRARTEVESTVVPSPNHVFQRPVILRLDSVDDVVVDDQLLRLVSVDSPCDKVVDDIAIESHVFRVEDEDTLAQARRNSGISHTFYTFSGIMELDRSLIGCFLRAIKEGDIVDVNLTEAVREVFWLEEVRDKNLAAVWARVGG